MDNKQIDLLLLNLSVEIPDFGNALIAAESLLEQDRYEEVEEKLAPFLNKSDLFINPAFFLIHYFLGQSIFRKEMTKKILKEKKIDRAIDHLSKSIDKNAEYMDAYMLRGLASIIKAKLCSPGLEWLKSAQQDFIKVLKGGNEFQKSYATERLEFISSVFQENA